MKNNGILITFEGNEGCGKTTHALALERYLSQKGLDVILTREPGGTSIGNQIRKILLRKKNRDILPEAELFLYAASRAQHIKDIILPSLSKGTIVVCDRFIDATFAYQGYGRCLKKRMVYDINLYASGGVLPDITFILDLPPEVGLKRAIRRNRKRGLEEIEGRFEEEKLDFHKRVREGYLKIGRRNRKRVKTLDALQSIEKINSIVCRKVEVLLRKHYNE